MSKFKKDYILESQADFKPLFDAFKLTERYQQKGFSQKISFLKNKVENILTREDLNAIEDLKISFKDNAKVIINQIDELCPNLKTLSVATMSDVFLTKEATETLNKKVKSYYNDNKKIEFIDSIHYFNKLNDEDMKHIANLTKLEELRIPNQTHITKLDCSKMPNLKILFAKNCINLQNIIGFNDNLFEYNYATYDFTGCEKISDQSIDEIASKFDYKRFNEKSLLPGHLFLPLNAMLRKNLKNKDNFVEFGKHYNRDTVLFSQYSNGVLLNHFAANTKNYCNELDKIIASSCEGVENNMKKIYKLYSWVTNNISYDKKTHELENENFEALNQVALGTREASENRSEMSRSAVYTLKKKCGVCVAISELFADLVFRAGVAKDVRQVACASETVGVGIQTIYNHQITAISVDGKSQYYFDPTGDLYRFKPIYFARNKAETESKYTLSYRERFTNNSPSLYNITAKDKEDFNL